MLHLSKYHIVWNTCHGSNMHACTCSGKKSFVCDFQSTLIHFALLNYKDNSYKLQLFSMSRACDFQQCGILTSVDSDEPVYFSFKLRNSH